MEAQTKGTITRGTTPTFEVTADCDLTGSTCYLAIGIKGNPLVTKTVTGVDGGAESSTVGFPLTQADTLMLRPGNTPWQMRAVKDDSAIATGIGSVIVEDVIQYGELNDLD